MVKITAGPAIKRPYLTLPDGWDTCWRAALANNLSTPARVLMVGEDAAMGFWANDWKQSWFDLWRANVLARGYQLSGDFIPPYYSAKAVSPIVFPGTMPFFSNASAASQTFGSWGLGANMFVGSQADLTLYPITFNSNYMPTPNWIDGDLILQNRQTSATISYNVDAGATQIATLAGNDDTLFRAAIPTQSNAPHIITLTNVSADGTHILNGICTYQNRNAGVQFARLAVDGPTLSSMGFDTVNNPFAVRPADRIRLWQGIQHSGADTGFGFPTQPDLAILELGSEDMQYGRTAYVYKRNLTRLCEALRRGKRHCSIIHIIPNVPSPVSSIWTGGGKTDIPNATSWNAFVTATKEVAAQFGNAVYNNHEHWGSYGYEDGWLDSGTPIPNQAGHTEIARILGTVT